MASLGADVNLKVPASRLLIRKELTLKTEAVLEFAKKELHLKPSILKGYQKPGGVALKGGLNQVFHVAKF